MYYVYLFGWEEIKCFYIYNYYIKWWIKIIDISCIVY